MKFTKPVGATADLRELEYISALHQTGKTLRRDGSVRADDIAKFLMSRYGIKVTEDEVTETIAKGFGGGGLSDEDGDTIDLTEIVALMLVPTLLKAEMSLHRDHVEHETISYNNKNPISSECSDSDEKVTADSNMKNYELHTKKSGHPDVWASGTSGKTRAFRGEDRWPDSDIIGFVLRMILADVTGDDEPKPMTKDLLKKIFVFYGEHDVADNEGLLEEMIAVASDMNNADEECNDPIFDQFAFAHCLTEDVRRYDIKKEKELSTNYSDVFEAEGGHNQRPMLGDGDGDVRKVETVWTAPSIDYAVDTFRGKSYVVLLWVNWALFFYVFMWNSEGKMSELKCSNEATTTTETGFSCKVAQGVVDWLFIMARLVIIGSGSVILCSMGHNTNPTTRAAVVTSILSMGSICIFTFVPAFIGGKVVAEKEEDEFGNRGALINTDQADKDGGKIFLIYVMVAFGAMLLLLAFQNLLVRIIPVRYLDSMDVLKRALTSGTIYMERNMKLAASFKVNKMIGNARAIHDAANFQYGAGPSSSKESSYGRALLSFAKTEADFEEIGGCCWTWRRVLNKKLFTEDGIWLNNRMVQGNVGQIVLCVWLIPFLQVFWFYVQEFYQSFIVMEIAPAKWRIMVPVALAFVVAEFNALKLTTSYTPSSVKTTLKFRYGVLGSLHDPEFAKVRIAVDDASFIFGAMFWGCLFSSGLILIMAFLVFVLIFYEPFLPYLLQIVATIIGIGITVGIKNVLLMLARKKFHQRAFYRTNPAAANVIGVILEAWSLGISTLYVLKRMIFLVSASFIFIGRIDIPLLSEDADQLGPLNIDNFPFMFRKDILTHEAHRHPYLEMIGVMYMLKLKHGEAFGREAGTSWRLLFVFALFPWLRKYRIRSDDSIDADKFNFSKDGAVFNKFVSAKADGLKGRLPRAKTEEGTADSTDADGEGDVQATIATLKREILKLREKNEFLLIASGVAKPALS